eukprot:366387-Chlamydomonas_euryale.AAC.27
MPVAIPAETACSLLRSRSETTGACTRAGTGARSRPIRAAASCSSCGVSPSLAPASTMCTT